MHYTVAVYHGPEIDDYFDLPGRFTKAEVLSLLRCVGAEDNYNYSITAWDHEEVDDGDGLAFGTDMVQGTLNGELFVLDPDAIFDEC